MQQFSIKHLLWMALSFSVPLAVHSYSGVVGITIGIAVSGFWLGMGCLFISDVIDDRPIDDRSGLSQALSVVGAMLAWFSALGGCVYVALLTAIYLLFSVGVP